VIPPASPNREATYNSVPRIPDRYTTMHCVIPSLKKPCQHLAWIVFLSSCVALSGCQSDEEKIAAFMENGDAYVEAESLKEAVIEYRNVLQLDPNNAEAHYALAKAYLELKRGKEAYWELSESVRLAPSNAEARLSLGGLSLVAKDFEAALEQAEMTIELDATSGRAHILHGQALERLERGAEAEAPYLKAIEVEPEEGSYRLILAGYYARKGDREKAEPRLHEFVNVDPGFRSYSALARFLTADRERVEEATAAFEKAIELANEDQRPSSIQNLANYYFALGRRDDTLALLKSAIGDESLAGSARLDLTYVLARYHRTMGNVEEADKLIEAAAVDQPNEVKPHLILSAYRGRKGDLQGALEAAEAALGVEPENTRALLRKAELLIDLGFQAKDQAQIGEGRAIVEGVLAKESTNPDALFVQGKAELAVSNSEEAVRALRAATDARPNWAQAHFVLGSALSMRGETNAARAEVARAVELDESLVEARRMLARLHAGLGEHEYAVEQGRAFLEAKPDDVKTRILVAQSLVRIGRREEAMKELDKIPEEDWGAEVFFARARLLLGEEDVVNARKFLARAAELKPNHPEILGTLVAIDRGTPRLAGTKALVEAAVAAEPENSELMRLRGGVALIEGDREMAEKSLQRATELNPNNMRAYQQLATFYQSAGRLDATLATYERALAQQPDSARLHHFVAVLYELAGRVDDAMASYEKAIQIDGSLAQAKNNLAYLLAEANKDLDRALDLAQEAKSLMPESGNTADTLGWVLHKRGVSSAAVGYLKEAAATIDPNSPTIGVVRHHLAQAYEANDQTREATEVLEHALADLERKLADGRERGEQPVEPDWSGPARDMLTRLKPAG
jgi:tetratricopeptide (TPR) repeat protein